MRQRRGVNLQSIKWQNRGVVLETLWRQQPLARKDLAARTHLTAATLTNIVTEFIDAGIVQEVGPGEPGRGRRPTLLRFAADSAFIIGVNLSRTSVDVGVFNMALDCLHLITHPVDVYQAQPVPDTLADLIRQALVESAIDVTHAAGIGVSGFGPLGAKDDVRPSPPSFAQWNRLPLVDLLGKSFQLPVWIENDANADALAELWLGAGRSYSNFIYVVSHSGLGAGVILNGRLFKGSTGIAGELGHTSIDPYGPHCDCGNRGCVELYSNEPAIVRYVCDRFKAGRSTGLTQSAGNQLEDLTLDRVINAALDGDDLAREAIVQACHALGLSLVSAVNLLDPEAIIIGHKLNRTGTMGLSVIRAVVQERAFPQAASNLEILTGELTEFVSVTGAACCALSGLFQEPHHLLAGSFSDL
ncbi:MAG: ROK family protein [Chloroflexi bacterium]|nr:ROK family protein [Chloroflexota bacterium]